MPSTMFPRPFLLPCHPLLQSPAPLEPSVPTTSQEVTGGFPSQAEEALGC